MDAFEAATEVISKAEASKRLFADIPWDEVIRSDLVKRREYQILENAHANFELVLNSAVESKELARVLVMLADVSTNLPVLQYAFIRIQEILGLHSDFDSLTAAGQKNIKLFSNDGIHFEEEPFKKALIVSDANIQRAAALCYACLLTNYTGDCDRLMAWVNSKLTSSIEGFWESALPALHMLTSSQSVRVQMLDSGIVRNVVVVLGKLGINGNAQHVYELCFILWALSLGDAAVDGADGSVFDNMLHAYLSSGVIRLLVDFMSAAPTRKVVRMALGTLRNLARTENDNILNEMLTAGLLRQIEAMSHSNFAAQAGDEDVEQDFKTVHETLVRNYRDLSSYERWASEVTSGALRWGILHNEKFWRENARFVEHDNFKLLKELIALLGSPDPTIVCVALYDIGEFTRFYPNGRVVVSRLGAKDAVMNMMSHEDTDIQRHTLQCISKVMVTNWEFLR